MDATTGSIEESLKKLSSWAKNIAEQLVGMRHADVAAEIDKVIAELHQSKFTLAVLGKAKRGKSTLMNALLGRDDDTLAPIDRLPASSAITRFSWSEQEKAVVAFQDGGSEIIPFNRIREFVTEEENPENRKNVTVVSVSGPFPGMDRNMELVDTPGAGSVHEHHDAILHAFIPQADVVIFMVTARMPLDQDELDLLNKVKAADVKKIFFVINKVDEAEESDIAAAIEHNRRLLSEHGIPVVEISRISARTAFRGQPGSGVDELKAMLNDFIARNRLAMITAQFTSRVLALVEPALVSINVRMAGSTKSDAELNAEIAALRTSGKKLKRDAEHLERGFDIEWESAVNRFARDLTKAGKTAQERLDKLLDDTGVLKLGALTKSLPTRMNRIVEEACEPAIQSFEMDSQKACQTIQASYPVISMDTSGGVSIKSPSFTGSIVTGLTGGAALAAGGAGLAYAGAATAAGIAAANAAAMAAAATTASFASAVGGLTTVVSTFLGAGPVAGLLGEVAAGATVAAVGTPTAITAAPMWVALAGPVGWTLAGVGLLAVPLSWRLAKGKQKDRLAEAAREHLVTTFQEIEKNRIGELRDMGKKIRHDLHSRLTRQLDDIEESLEENLRGRVSQNEMAAMTSGSEAISALISQAKTWLQ